MKENESVAVDDRARPWLDGTDRVKVSKLRFGLASIYSFIFRGHQYFLNQPPGGEPCWSCPGCGDKFMASRPPWEWEVSLSCQWFREHAMEKIING